MRAFGFIASSLALVLAVTASPAKQTDEKLPVVYGYKQGDECPAEVFYNDCNYCFCLADGHSAGCTKMACPSDRLTRKDDDIPTVYNYKNGDKCPGKVFYDDCNNCVCNSDGHSAFCTLKFCISSTRKALDIPVVHGYKHGDKCPASHFYNDCNYCFCFPDGHSAGCTRKACLQTNKTRQLLVNPNVVVVDGYKQGDKCPAQNFYDKCNACVCGKDGHSAACTRKWCARSRKPIPQHPHIDNFDDVQKCTPNEIFHKKCNTCRCSSDGVNAKCTLMACSVEV